MDSYLRYINKEERVFGKPPIGCVLDLAGRPFSGDIIKDNSPYGNNGTITGATWVRNERGLWVQSFDGTDDRITVADADSIDVGIGDFTFIFDWKPTTDARQAFLDKSQGNVGTLPYMWATMELTTNLVEFYIYDGTTSIDAGSDIALTLNAWSQIALVAKRGVGSYIYINGVAHGQTLSTNAQGTLSNNGNLHFGGRWGATNLPLGGILGQEREYKRALTTGEIANIFNQERHLFI